MRSPEATIVALPEHYSSTTFQGRVLCMHEISEIHDIVAFVIFNQCLLGCS